MRTADFDFDLPKELIAVRPSEIRDLSRLLVLHRDGRIEHRTFADIAEYLGKGDMLLLNDTKVFPARIIGTKPSGGKIDMLLVRELDGSGTWEVLCRGGFSGTLTVLDGIRAELGTQGGARSLRFPDIDRRTLDDMLWRHGRMPLPPYIKRDPDDEDKRRYQTVYAERQGSIAAPTAGLHFTDELLGKIREQGVIVRTVTLHVGTGTFKPVKAGSPSGHRMDPEYFEIGQSLMGEIADVKRKGNRLVAVGTTATRTIEGFMSGSYKERDASGVERHALKDKNNDSLDARRATPDASRLLEDARRPFCGYTDVFIYPGYEFKAVDSLITNFHLPRSTPLMLVAALSGLSNISRAYKDAIALNYRFFSYGDAMLIL